ncbi:polyprenyl synthetase family protein [Enterococcus dispar]|uniref:Polyprenyl synthetase n=1 Tax=Enterococcus dispar ATCC 51266 TaxID=1139219 RepID=S1P207_9ENTE|nr:polyprenyl synthetase family protein [Enterococcus dispar]EOT39199.1 polyprenyl synthetase [Enterococcus dispar ATCC 51266]EOW86386.1 polyprenyl synthetase [Enterococcus dispar ATCC 51266]OJG38242.1 polyprenyl synthetase [Enterococcus dispar]
MKLHPLWQEYPALQPELRQTLTLMEDSIKLKNKPVADAILSMIHSGGKLLRPAYQLLFSQFGPEQDRKKAVSLAASIEMLHTATLVHDDIVDEADLRRGLQTIRSEFGNAVAVYAGDFLFVCCFKLMADYASSMRSLQINSRSMEKILNGELGQMDTRFDTNVTINDYLENISGKTAELFSLSCSVGALESGTGERFAKQCGDIGQNIGMAFQIIDDILDYSQPATAIGKPVLEDVRQGVYSLPLLLALQKAPQQVLPLLEKRGEITDEEVETLYGYVHEFGGVEAAKAYAEDYTDKALKGIKKLPDNDLNTKAILLRLTQTILERKN